MYGCGEQQDQYLETVELLDKITVDHMKTLANNCASFAADNDVPVSVEVLQYILSNRAKDEEERIQELTKLYSEINSAKKQKFEAS